MKWKLFIPVIYIIFFPIVLSYSQEALEEGSGPVHIREGLFFVPGADTIFENYRIKILKVFTMGRESKIKLREKARDLRKNLGMLIEKYNSDKSVSKDIVSDLKEISEVHFQIQEINKDTLKKTEDLYEARQKEMRAAFDAWLSKLEQDNKELDKFIDEYRSRSTNEPD